MTRSTIACHLSCLQKTHDDIPLPDREPVLLGRSPLTKITDPRCSRNQVEITADWKSQKVKVKQLGGNTSAIDGNNMQQNEITTMKADSTLFILSGQYPHKVVFKTEEKGGKLNNQEILSSSLAEKIEKKHKVEADSITAKTNHKNMNMYKKDVSKHESSSENGKDVSKHTSSNSKGKKDTSSGHDSSMSSKSSAKDESSKKSSSSSHKQDSIHKSNRKRSVDSSHERGDVKKMKLDNSGRTENVDDEKMEEEHVNSVAAKLEEMKKAAEATKSGSKQSESSKKLKSYENHQELAPAAASSSLSSSLSKSATETSTWESHEHLYVYTSKGVTPSTKIAAFDLDGTIILTKSGKKFPTDSGDWKIAFHEVPKKLKGLIREGYKIVFFTNQLGVARGKTKIEDLKKKIENVVHSLQVPVQVFVATHEGKYRKPSDGMWKQLTQQYNARVSIDKNQSLYVGDAAGRPANWAHKKPKDFSLSDRLFALNVGIKFETPEEFFLGQKPPPFNMPAFDPRKLKSDDRIVPQGCNLISSEKEVLVLVGFPASGKSYLANNTLKPKGYEVISRDTLRSWQKCVQKTKEALVNSKVVIDNTNLTREERARYVACAKDAGVPCRCLVFTTTIEHCRHNERFRQLTDKSHAKINEIIFNTIKSKFEEPSMSEGFSEIININFVPKFTLSSQEAEYRKFLLEK